MFHYFPLSLLLLSLWYIYLLCFGHVYEWVREEVVRRVVTSQSGVESRQQCNNSRSSSRERSIAIAVSIIDSSMRMMNDR